MSVAASPGRPWVGLAILGLPTLLIGLDLTVLHLAAPAIAAELRPGATANLWIIDVYGFAVAGLLLTMGNVGDRIGRRRLLMIGAAGFALASILAAFSSSAGMLIAARALLGVAGATLMPSTLSLIRDLFADDRQRTVAISIWMACLLTGSAIGPLVGGLLLEAFWWGSVFLISVPVMAALLVLAPRLLPAGSAQERRPVDGWSVALSFLAMFPVVYAIKDVAAHGLGVAPVALAVLGGLAARAFVRRQRRLESPMLDVALFRGRLFRAAVATHFGALAAVAGMQYLTALYLQISLGMSPLTAGLWTLPAAAGGLLGAVAAGPSVRVLPPLTVIGAGLAVGAAGLGLVALAPEQDGLGVVVVGFALASFAVGLATALTTDIIVSAAPPEKAGMASGVSETAAELGIATGMAILGSITTAVVAARTGVGIVPGMPEVPAALVAGLKLSAGAATLVLVALTAACLRQSWAPPARRRAA